MIKGHLLPKIKKGQNACPIQHWTRESCVEDKIREKEGKLALHMLSLYKQSPRKATEESQVTGVQQGNRTQC